MEKSKLANKTWHEEFGLPVRVPLWDWESVRHMVLSAWPPTIHLVQRKKFTDVVVTFKGSFATLSRDTGSLFRRMEGTYGSSFEEIIWKKLNRNEHRTAWSQLARYGYGVFVKSWVEFLRQLYVHHFHPRSNQTQIKRIEAIEKAAVLKRGRRTESALEQATLVRRYKELMKACRLIHTASNQVRGRAPKATPKEARKQIWEMIGKEVYGSRFDYLIFGERVFKEMPRHKRDIGASLDAPETWTPRQLSLAILSFQTELKYSTLEKKLRARITKS